MKTILALVLVGALQLCAATPLPEPGLLRVPRIYNALITSDAKLQPSRASPYSVPAVPVIGPLGDFARIDETQPNHHAPDKKVHNYDPPKKTTETETVTETETENRDVPATGKDIKKPSSRMYPETFYPQSVGYYPHPFIPYSYPLAPQPYPFGQYSSAGVGGGPGVYDGSFSAVGGPGFGAGGGLRAGYGPYGGLFSGPAGSMPTEFSIDESSSFHMSSGRRQGVANAGNEEEAESEGDADEGDDDADADADADAGGGER